MSYDFGKLQTIQCADALTLRVPARWLFEASPDMPDRWCCYEKNVETGTLWISIDRFGISETADPNPDFRSRRTVDEFVAFQSGNVPAPIQNSVITQTKDGYLWTYNHDSVEDGERLANISFMFFSFADNLFAYTNFKLVLLAEQLDDPEFRDLVALMDGEIRAARIDPFSSMQTDEDDDPLASLRRANFAGQVALDLPDTLQAQPFGDEEYEWYCYFEPDTVEARIRVISTDQNLRDEDGNAVSADEEDYEAVVRRIIDSEDGEADISAVPQGILVHKIYDDDAATAAANDAPSSGWPSGPLRNHSWRYFRFAHGTLRRVNFLLTLPLPRAESAQLSALVDLLEREIRRADFPDLAPPPR